MSKFLFVLFSATVIFITSWVTYDDFTRGVNNWIFNAIIMTCLWIVGFSQFMVDEMKRRYNQQHKRGGSDV